MTLSYGGCPPRPWDHVPCGVASSIGPQSADLLAGPPFVLPVISLIHRLRAPYFRFVTLSNEVVLCKGAKVPLMLRRKELRDKKKRTVYKFISNTYIYSVIEGKL